MLASFSMLKYQTAMGTGSELGSAVDLELIAIIMVSQLKFFIPRAIGKKVNKKLALFVSTK